MIYFAPRNLPSKCSGHPRTQCPWEAVWSTVPSDLAPDLTGPGVAAAAAAAGDANYFFFGDDLIWFCCCCGVFVGRALPKSRSLSRRESTIICSAVSTGSWWDRMLLAVLQQLWLTEYFTRGVVCPNGNRNDSWQRWCVQLSTGHSNGSVFSLLRMNFSVIFLFFSLLVQVHACFRPEISFFSEELS